MGSEHDYHIAAEADVTGKANRHIWYYFIILGVMLFATIGGLTIMYSFQVDYEKEKKIGQVNTQESMNQVALSEAYLSGKRGLLEGKRHVAVDSAIHRFVNEIRKQR